MVKLTPQTSLPIVAKGGYPLNLTALCHKVKNRNKNKPIINNLNVNHNDNLVEVRPKKLRLLRVCIRKKLEIVIGLCFTIPTRVEKL